MSTTLPPESAVFIAPDLTLFETTSPGSYADDVTIEGRAFRRLDAAYYAWLRHKMQLARAAVASRRLSAATFEGLRAKFNEIHALAVEILGAPALAAATHAFNPARYDPPRPDDDLSGSNARRSPPAPRSPSTFAFPAAGDSAHTEAVGADAVARVDAVRDEALALGWAHAALYGNRGHLRFPYGDEYGLVCFLDDGASIAAVSREAITIRHARGNALRFPNPDVDQPWRRRVEAVVA